MSGEFTFTVSKTRKGNAAIWAHEEPPKVRLNLRLISQRSLSARIDLNLNHDAALTDWHALQVANALADLSFTSFYNIAFPFNFCEQGDGYGAKR